MSANCIKDTYPIYIGIFFNESSRKKFNKDFKSSGLLLDKNSHVTLKYLGQEKIIPDDLNLLLNQKITVDVIGISESDSGTALIVKHDIPKYNINSHITLKVNKNSKPVDVGKSIDLNNIKKLDLIKLDGIITSFCHWNNNINNINVGRILYRKICRNKKSCKKKSSNKKSCKKKSSNKKSSKKKSSNKKSSKKKSSNKKSSKKKSSNK
jgi:hypothetical protein